MFVGKFTNIEVKNDGTIFINEIYNNFSYRVMDPANFELLADLMAGEDPDKVYHAAFKAGILSEIS